jgi:hypothetical protein
MRFAFAVAAILAGPLSAQWLHTPTQGVPRSADGKLDVTAPAPKAADGHPDLSGVWMPNTRALQDLAVDLKPGDVPYQPWAEKVFKERANGAKSKDDPAAYCVPGMPKLIVLPYPYKIFQLPGVTVILYEGFTHLPADFHRRARVAEGSATFVARVLRRQVGRRYVRSGHCCNQRKTWMDNAGRPHSDALHTIERYRRRNFGTMDVTITFDDPKAYTKPWTVNENPSRLVVGQDLLEYVCTENNKDIGHLFGDGQK